MKKYVIVVAGGKGLRMGGEIPKQFIPVKGKPVLMRTLETFHACDPNIELIVVLSGGTAFLLGSTFVLNMALRCLTVLRQVEKPVSIP